MWIIKKYDEKRVRKSLAQTRLRGWWGGGGRNKRIRRQENPGSTAGTHQRQIHS